MVRWVRRFASVTNSILLFGLFYEGQIGVAIVGGLLNLACALEERLSPRIRRFLRSWALIINTAFLAYGILSGGPSILAMLLAGSSLLSWNAGLFLERWADAPRALQYRYLRRVGSLITFGLLTGVSALALQRHLALSFFPALLLMLAAIILWLQIISRSLKSEKPG